MRPHFVLLLLPSLLGAGVAARAEIIERIVAKVNGEIITLTEFQERQIAAAQAARISPTEIGAFLRQNNARILQDAIDEILLVQRAEDAGLGLRPEYIDEVIESIKEDNNITSEEQFQEALAQEGLTLDKLRDNIANSMTRRMILQRDIEPKISLSEEELRSEYEERKAAEFTKAATVTLQEIYIPDDGGGIVLARNLVERARGGEDFADLARTYSAAPSRESGGELGEIAQGDLSPELEEVAFGLPVGSVSDPIPVGEGHRIVKVAAKTSGSVIPFETAKNKLRNQLMMARFESEYETYIEDLRKNAVVELRVREVPLQLSGPVPEDSLLEGVDPFSLGPATLGPPAAAAGQAATSPSRAAGGDDEFVTTPQARPERVVPPGSALEDEISTTPQSRPERVAPPGAATDEQTETKPPSR